MLRFSAFLLPAALLFLPAAHAQTPPSASEKPVTFTIMNGDLLTTLVRLERQYHIQCVLQDGVDAHSKINIRLSDVPLFQALNSLASSANAQVTQSPDGVYLFTPKPTVASTKPDYFMPPTHLVGSFGIGGFGMSSFSGNGFGSSVFGGSSQTYPSVVFPRTLPVPLSDVLNRQRPRYAEPTGVQRIFALGQSF